MDASQASGELRGLITEAERLKIAERDHEEHYGKSKR